MEAAGRETPRRLTLPAPEEEPTLGSDAPTPTRPVAQLAQRTTNPSKNPCCPAIDAPPNASASSPSQRCPPLSPPRRLPRALRRDPPPPCPRRSGRRSRYRASASENSITPTDSPLHADYPDLAPRRCPQPRRLWRTSATPLGAPRHARPRGSPHEPAPFIIWKSPENADG
jgi:hypothetical protein